VAVQALLYEASLAYGYPDLDRLIQDAIERIMNH
jgi:hypothetical protein